MPGKKKKRVDDGIRLPMPEISRLADRIRRDLICRHGCRQAKLIAQMAYERLCVDLKVQVEKGSR